MKQPLKIFRNLFLYCILFLFLFSLSSSFAAEEAMGRSVKNVSLSNETMKRVFYEQSVIEGGQLAEEGDPEAEGEEEIIEYEIGDSGEGVQEYQKILYYLDYYTGPKDGNFQESLEQAVLDYQAAEGLEQNGKLDTPTIEAIRLEAVIYREGHEGEEIATYQKILEELGYLTAYEEEVYDLRVSEAVRSYQEEQQMDITGTLDEATRQMLEQSSGQDAESESNGESGDGDNENNGDNGTITTYRLGDSADEVARYQQILIDLGYLDDVADGHYGGRTADAVLSFQYDYGLEGNGEITPQTAQTLLEEEK
ncbi:MAG TPA: hypothetical protein DHN33_11340 [Eubacteriaceae bacterium]|nr:hypothetical protein [Eubacteriaceae bacterium]